MITPPTPRLAQPATASRTPARGMASAAQSTPAGKAEVEFTHGRPLISARPAFTRWISPRNPKRSRLASRLAPREPGDGEAPTMAIERGRSMRSIADRADPPEPGTGSTIALVSAESRPEALVIQELLEPLVAAVLGVEEASLGTLRHQVFVRLFPGHELHVAHRRLGGPQHGRVLAEQFLGKRSGTRAQLRTRTGLVDQAHLGGLAAIESAAGHYVIHGVAEIEGRDRRAGDVAARNDAPIDLREAELRILGRDREVTGDERREGAAEAPAVDHCDGRLRIVHEHAPLPLPGRAARAHLLRIGELVDIAEILLEVHAGGEGIARAGEHENAGVVCELDRVEHLHHLVVECRAHGIALFRAVQRYPGDPILDLEQHVPPIADGRRTGSPGRRSICHVV